MSNSRCYICFKKQEFFQESIRAQNATYTETPIKTYLEQFAGQSLTTSEEELDKIILCQECLAKINDYDLACLTARNIENDLRDMLQKSKEMIIKEEISIKDEIEYVDAMESGLQNNTDDESSDDEKPLVQIKREIKKTSVKRKRKVATNNGGIKKLGRPRTRNKIVIRNAKSSIPDSEVPANLKCLICAFQVRTLVSYKVFLFKIDN